MSGRTGQGYVYWTWHQGDMSRLHREHPNYPDTHTWCGCVLQTGIGAGVRDVVHTGNAGARKMCEQCAAMTKPIKMQSMGKMDALIAKERGRAKAKRKYNRIAGNTNGRVDHAYDT